MELIPYQIYPDIVLSIRLIGFVDYIKRIDTLNLRSDANYQISC